MKTTHFERQWAQLVAKLMRSYNDLWNKAARADLNAASESDWKRFHEHMRDGASNIYLYFCMLCGHSNANLARSLRLIADALDRKLRGTKYEEAFLIACERAQKRRWEKRRQENKKTGRRGMSISDLMGPPLQDVNDILPLVCTEMGLEKAPHRDHVRRLAHQTGRASPAKLGRRKKLPLPEVTRNRGNKVKRSLSQSLPR